MATTTTAVEVDNDPSAGAEQEEDVPSQGPKLDALSLDELQQHRAKVQRAHAEQISLQQMVVDALVAAKKDVSQYERQIKQATKDKDQMESSAKHGEIVLQSKADALQEELDLLKAALSSRESRVQSAQAEQKQVDEHFSEQIRELVHEKQELEGKLSESALIQADLNKALRMDPLAALWMTRVYDVKKLIQEKQRTMSSALVSRLKGITPESTAYMQRIAERKLVQAAVSSSQVTDDDNEVADDQQDEKELPLKRSTRKRKASVLATANVSHILTKPARKRLAKTVPPAAAELQEVVMVIDDDNNNNEDKGEDEDEELGSIVSEYADVQCFGCDDPTDDIPILLCDGCDRGFHIHCVGKNQVPKGDWFCKYCTPAGEARNSSSSSAAAIVKPKPRERKAASEGSGMRNMRGKGKKSSASNISTSAPPTSAKNKGGRPRKHGSS